MNLDLDNTNSINPVKVDRFRIEKQLPNLRMADNIDMQHDDDPLSEDSGLDVFVNAPPIEPKDNPVKKVNIKS
jgi:hypothetical protein